MKDDQYRFLTLMGQLPVRVTAEQAAWMLNCQPDDIPALVAGNPPSPSCCRAKIDQKKSRGETSDGSAANHSLGFTPAQTRAKGGHLWNPPLGKMH